MSKVRAFVSHVLFQNLSCTPFLPSQLHGCSKRWSGSSTGPAVSTADAANGVQIPSHGSASSRWLSPGTDCGALLYLVEFFLFHGLNGGLYADKITRFGMDPRYSSVEGMFGAGLYFADLASKSNQYVHCGKCKLSGAMPRDPVGRSKFVRNCKCKQSDVACALLCRVTLGDTLIEKNYRGNSPGQFWHARRREPEKPGGGIFNSVVGESRANGGSSLEFRECEWKLRPD